jgi:protein-tyrosine phosphatase
MKTEILAGLWLSSKDEITESKFLLEKNLDFIVNCSTSNIEDYVSLLNEKYGKNIKYVNLPIRDVHLEIKRNSTLLVDNMNDITNMIYKYIKKNKNVVVVCNTGKLASFTIGMCYIIRYGKVDFDYASVAIRSKNTSLDAVENIYNYTIKQYYIELKQQSQ